MKNLILVAGIVLHSFLTVAQKPVSTLSHSEQGLSYVGFETGEGRVTAVMPSRVHAGDVISGTVLADPRGKNERQRSGNAKVLSGYVIEMENAPSPAKKGRFTWKIPVSVAGGVVGLLLKDSRGVVVARSPFTVDPSPRTSLFSLLSSGRTGELLPDEFRVIRKRTGYDIALPGYLRAGQTEMITGLFDGDSQNSAITLGDAELGVLAESPEGIFFTTPDSLSGRSTLGVTEQDNTYSKEVNIVELQLAADRLTLTRGQTTLVSMEVSGLDGLESPLSLTISNLTPEIITMGGGNEQRKLIDPREAGPDGIFRETREVTATQSGAFSVLVAVEPPPGHLLRILSPADGSLADSEPIKVIWAGTGFPEKTLYDLSVYPVPEESGAAPAVGKSDPVISPEGIKPAYTVTGLAGNTHTLPGEWADKAGESYSGGLFTVRVEARDPATGAVLGETTSGFQTVSSSRRCRCGNNSSSYVQATVSKGGSAIALARLEGNPSVLDLPEGPLTLAFTGADLDCGTCGRNECTVENVGYNPAVPVIMPGSSIQTLEVTVTWNCVLEDCLEGECTKTLKLKYRLAPARCECGDVAVTVEAENVNARKPANQGTGSSITSHRPAGSSGAAIVGMGNGLRYESGDEVEITISDIEARCWCGTGLCTPEPTDDGDVRNGKPVTIELGENDADAANDNHNLVRISRPGDGWQADGSYRIHAAFSNTNSNTRDVYQDFTLKYWCTQEDCSRKLCTKNFRIHFGFF